MMGERLQWIRFQQVADGKDPGSGASRGACRYLLVRTRGDSQQRAMHTVPHSDSLYRCVPQCAIVRCRATSRFPWRGSQHAQRERVIVATAATNRVALLLPLLAA